MDDEERRSARRYCLADNGLLLCAKAAGEIIDISLRGLAFTHVAGEQWPTGEFVANLLLEKSATLIESVPCELVDQEEVAGPMTTHWRHSVKFGTLSENQQRLLLEALERSESQLQMLPLAS